MKPQRDRERLEHMASHAAEAIDIAGRYERSDLERNRMLDLSLVRLLEIVGEAASKSAWQ